MSIDQKNPGRLHALLLARVPYAAPGVHRAAFASASAEQDLHLLRTLVTRPDAPDDLLEQYATVTDPEVRAAFLSRPDGAGRRLVPDRARERRASVLARYVTRPDVTAQMVDDALAAFDDKATLTLARALATQPSWLTPDRAHRVLATLAAASPTTSTTDPTAGEVAALGARAGRALVQDVLAAATSPVVVAGLVGFDVPDAVAAAALNRTAAYLRQVAEQPGQGPRCTPGIEVIVDVLNATKQGTALVDAFVAEVGAGPVRTRAYRYPGWKRMTRWDTRPADLPPIPTLGRRAWQDLTGHEQIALAASADLAVLDEVLAWSLTVPASTASALWRTLLYNPAFTGGTRRQQIAQAVLAAHEAGESLFRLTDLNLGCLPHQDEHVIATWVHCFPARVLTSYGWGPFGGPDAAAQVLARAADRGEVAHRELVDAIATVGVPARVVPSLTVPDAMALLERQHNPDTSIALGWVTALDGLGAGPGAWALFDQLLATFTGTVAELVATCHTATT